MNASELLSLLAPVGLILVALLAGVVSPGPSFLQVARISVARSRADGLAAALGLGLGAVFFAVLALAGLHAVLTAVPTLYLLLKVAGGLYLLWMAWNIWRGASQPLDTAGAADEGTTARQSLGRSFRVGLVTQLSNPKCAVVYGSVFAALLPPHLPLMASAVLVCGVLLMETGWYAIVALVLSSTAPRAVYLRGKKSIDRAAAGVMGLLGLRLVVTAQQ